MSNQRCGDRDYYEIDGYVNAVGRDSRIIKDEEKPYVENIYPGTFNKVLKRTNNVIANVNHSLDKYVGSLRENNLELYEDSIGCYAKATPKKEEFDKVSDINKLVGWSLEFKPYPDAIEYETTSSGLQRRIIHDFDLDAVSIIDEHADGKPYYTGTSIKMRSESGRTILIRPSNVEKTLKIKKVFFSADDMKKFRAEGELSNETTHLNKQFEEDISLKLRKRLISEIYNSIK